jgi:uncharacterized DUF497 family protein
MELEFEWDENKRRVNLETHGIDFEDAIGIWEGEVLEVPSPQDHHGEKRFLAFGAVEGRVICVVFTHRSNRRRIIRARSARLYERENYKKAIERPPEG